LDLEFQFIEIPGQIILPFDQVEIIYHDDTGNVFESMINTQPTSSTFEIIRVQDFDPSPMGDATKFMELEINCLLFSKDGLDPLRMHSSATMVGAAYPGG
jgi:hypothetical protein